MILSFHPIVTGEENLICAGRPPGPEEIEALGRADAVFLPQGVREDLYRLARSHCPLVWPNYDARFDYPGKIGQSLLFAYHQVPRPPTVIFPSVMDFHSCRGDAEATPYILKSNHGGEGHGVFPVMNEADLDNALNAFRQNETNGRGGFVRQPLVDHRRRDLRVVLAGTEAQAYWRYASGEGQVLTNLSQGGRPDDHTDPHLIAAGIASARDFAQKARIDLAGFDLMFDRRDDSETPLFIEINYFFGRTALGGSDAFYKTIKKAAGNWLKSHGLKRGKVRRRPRYSQRD